jgi:cell division protein FtsW (lipid II flippase)
MRNRASSHLFALFIIIALEIIGYWAVYRAALLRGYAPTTVGAVRDILLYVPVIALLLWLARAKRYAGDWTLFTAAIVLFSIGLLVQYRLYSDPEYANRGAARTEARAEKTETLRLRYINRYYDAEKKKFLGLPPTVKPDTEVAPIRESNYTISRVLTSSYTWIPLISFLAFAIAYSFCVRDEFLNWVQRHSFTIALVTLVPLLAAVATSRAGKALGNMTPWEPSKIPFLLGFAGILAARYRDIAKTYWGIPSLRAMLPLVVMALIPFVPFFALKDFGQMLVFGGTYATLYFVAVRKLPQLVLFVGSVFLLGAILAVGALPEDVQAKVPTLTTLSKPVQAILPSRIEQRFHLWLDGFDPPSPETSWWKKEYMDALSKNPKMRELAESGNEETRRSVNVDIWFDRLAYQPSQATFGLAAGGISGRGIGLGYAEVIPVADSDYIYAAIGEELGVIGGAVVITALIVFVSAGVRTSLEGRDMFTKLCAAGIASFTGLQALVNMGGTTRALPMTGITLPFVSHGGFSLITSFAMLGMIMAFSHRNARDQAATDDIISERAGRAVRDEEEYKTPEAVQ